MKRLVLFIIAISALFLSLTSCSNRGYSQNGCPKAYGEDSKKSKKHWQNAKAYIQIPNVDYKWRQFDREQQHFARYDI